LGTSRRRRTWVLFVKARNANLCAICDVARDLAQRTAATYEPTVIYHDFADMLADPKVDAVVITFSDRSAR
jgi:predicted dehydrogenase